MSDKSLLRRHFRIVRRSLPAGLQQTHAHAVLHHLLNSRELLRARTIAGYSAANGEVDLSSVFDRLWHMQRTVALPVINNLGGRLEFYRYTAGEPLIPGQFNIPVPPLGARHIPLLRCALLLIPLVAYDDHGTRLGMGGGYYDRSLATLPRRLRPLVMGVAHAAQHSDRRLPRDRWDIPLDAIVTELGITRFRHP